LAGCQNKVDLVTGSTSEVNVEAMCGWLTMEDHIGDGLYCVSARDSIHDMSHKVEFNIYSACVEGTCACVHYINGAVVQLKPCRMVVECLLGNDVDPDWEYLVHGCIFGFTVINPDCVIAYESGNYDGGMTEEVKQVVRGKLLEEIESRCVSIVDKPMQCSHAIGMLSKGEGKGYRCIIDCSEPKDSVNEHTEGVCNTFSYRSVDDVTEVLRQYDYVSIGDIKDAYRAISIHGDSANRMGLSWEFTPGEVTYLRDNRLCMGLSSSPYVFSKVSDLVVRSMLREGYDEVINYLDDFAIVTRTFKEGWEAQKMLVRILRRLGFAVSFKKVTSPSQVSRFLGIEIDSIEMKLRLPADKLDKLHGSLEYFVGKDKAVKKDLEQLAGLLAHCAKVVRGGRVFTRRIYDLCASVKKPYHRVRLGKEFEEDLQWWLDFADFFNGEAKMFVRCDGPMLSTYSDSSTTGYGATHGNDWLAGTLIKEKQQEMEEWLGHHYVGPDEICYKSSGEVEHINILEMYAVVAAVERWGQGWENKDLCVVTDNTTVKSAINTGRSKCKEIMLYVRKLFWRAVQGNFNMCSVYLPSDKNTICDSLSRLGKEESLVRLREADSSRRMCCSELFSSDNAIAYCRVEGPAGQM
jgi:hypothetical protein